MAAQTLMLDGFIAELTIDSEAGLIHGEVVNTRAVLTFAAQDVAGLKPAFQDTLDDYKAWCKARGVQPERPYSGTISLRMRPELHRDVVAAAVKSSLSVNAFIISALEQATRSEKESPSGELKALAV
jgi:predicted HicB family RNase H-like nuclease